MSAPVLGCKWCGKKLGGKFARRCKDCGHGMYWHRISPSSQQLSCRGVVGCACTAIQPQSRLERTSEQFPRQRVGFGLDAKGLFCTNACAVAWAHKHAGVR